MPSGCMATKRRVEISFRPFIKPRWRLESYISWLRNLALVSRLRLFEDQQLQTPESTPTQWLSAWHSELDWLHAVHKTRYSNGMQFMSSSCVNLLALNRSTDSKRESACSPKRIY
jgi:hypothetical protein